MIQVGNKRNQLLPKSKQIYRWKISNYGSSDKKCHLSKPTVKT